MNEEDAMEYRKITAIVRREVVQDIEARLQGLGVGGITVTRVKGYGEYANFYSSDWLVSHARIEVFTTRARAGEIATAIMETAHTGVSGDGLVAVLPVEQIYRIRTKSPPGAEEL